MYAANHGLGVWPAGRRTQTKHRIARALLHVRLLIVPETPCLMQPWSQRKKLVVTLRLVITETMLRELNASVLYHRALFRCNRRASQAEASYFFSHSRSGPMTTFSASPYAVSGASAQSSPSRFHRSSHPPTISSYASFSTWIWNARRG